MALKYILMRFVFFVRAARIILIFSQYVAVMPFRGFHAQLRGVSCSIGSARVTSWVVVVDISFL